MDVAQRRSSFPNTLEFSILSPSTTDNLLCFFSKIKEVGKWQGNLYAQTDGWWKTLCPGFEMTLCHLGVGPHLQRFPPQGQHLFYPQIKFCHCLF